MPRSRLPLFVVTSVGKLHYAGSTSCCVPKLLFKRLLASLLACSLARSLAYLLASSLACLLGRLPARLLACFLARSLACLPARLLTCLLPCLLARPCLLGCLLAGCSKLGFANVFFLLPSSFNNFYFGEVGAFCSHLGLGPWMLEIGVWKRVPFVAFLF